MFHEKLVFRMLPWNTGALPSYFRYPPYWHRGSAADYRGRTGVYRDAPGHTVAPLKLHRECTVANRTITGTDQDQFMPKTGSGREHCREYVNALEFRPDSSRFTSVRRLQTAGTHRGVRRESVNEA